MTTPTYESYTYQSRLERMHAEQHGPASDVNISKTERLFSVLTGAAMLAAGVAKRGWLGLASSALGLEMIRRGVTGVCFVNKLLGINRAVVSETANVSVPHDAGIRVERAITVGREPSEVFVFWRDFTNLATFMENVESIQMLENGRTYWTVKGPAGTSVSWEAEIVNEEPDRLIAWRSLEGAEVSNAGSVRFTPAPGGRGTEIYVKLEYAPPAGKAGEIVAKLFGKDPNQQVAGDLRRLKQLLETGEIATVDGQSSGRS